MRFRVLCIFENTHLSLPTRTCTRIENKEEIKTLLNFRCDSKKATLLALHIHTECQKTQTKLLGQQ